ncbi:hypothetical protein [Aliikangiella sp. G2MR2-5]|uniref:hypothetical protein n=1 Tax=Aliikangiella sp. G2MR2-5 TaxID=2788943 RepID=UPI0018A916EB|nr:hypothetical protein [Aliikangiella sp. G2MR2-5]
MSDQKQKFLYILPAYFLAYLISVACPLLFRWIFSIKFQLFTFDEEVWEFYLPIFFPALVAYLLLRKRVKTLEFKENADNKQFVYIMLAWVSILPVEKTKGSNLLNKRQSPGMKYCKSEGS